MSFGSEHGRLRIDAALTPPGFIASAKMHTLIARDGFLYVLYSGPGPASRADWSAVAECRRTRRNFLDDAAVKAVVKSYLPAISAYEDQISDQNLEELAKARNCCKLSKAVISGMIAKPTAVDVRLSFKAESKKYVFDCGLEDKDLVLELVALFSR